MCSTLLFFLVVRRPPCPTLFPYTTLFRSLEGDSPVLLIDELDRTDEPFEAYLLEVLSDWQITIPEVGTLRASEPPIVVITDRKSTRLNSSHGYISYAVFCLKKKKD